MSFRPALAALIASVAGLAASEEDGAEFRWRSSMDEARAAARPGWRPILVYFPPVGGVPDPPVIAAAARRLGTPPSVAGLRVGPDEVVVLARRYSVEHVPCLLLLDSRENVVRRWAGVIPADLWRAVGETVLALGRRDAGLRKKAHEALSRSERGDLEGAWSQVSAIVGSAVAPPDAVEAARRVERRLVDDVRARMLAALAREGIDEDANVRKDLESLAASTKHPGLRDAIRAEIVRLEGTRIGGG